MLNSLTANLHFPWVMFQSRLQCIDYRFMLPALHSTLCTRRTLFFHRARLAACEVVTAQQHGVFRRRMPPAEQLSRRASINMPPAEIEEIARFKKLTAAQKSLLLSASKESGKYTEGVILSKKVETLFRAVPPSLYLALAMTEPGEKAQRWQEMQVMRCTELAAAIRIALRIDEARGIL
jgi:hypothetical protein